MRYRTGAAFRQALTQRIGSEVSKTGLTRARLWRLVAFERLLARLRVVAPNAWVLKGGFALDLRLGSRARTTQDIDLAWLTDVDTAEETLLTGALHDLGDYFAFRIERVDRFDDADVGGATRHQVRCALAGTRLTEFHLDIGFSDPMTASPDEFPVSDLLAFADIPPIDVRVLSLAQHVAEKIHAYTRSYGAVGRPSGRTKDLVDMVLIQAHESLVAGDVRGALTTVFDARGTHDLPAILPPPPESWRQPYQRMAPSLEIPPDLDEGYQLAAAFLTPILDGTVDDAQTWDCRLGLWTHPS